MNRRTIIISMPVYNSEQTLSNAIESILNQTYNNIKLIIVDDCSTDKSLQIAKDYAKKDDRVSVYQNKKNMGAYYSRNVGLYVVKDLQWGFFTTHDADDISYPHRYQSLVKALRSNVNGVQDIFTRKDLESGRIINEKLTMAHAVFTRDVFESIGYFEETRFGADWEYWTRLKQFDRLNGFAVADYSEALGESFVHKTNLTIQIPVHSTQRKDYIRQTLKRLKKAGDKLYMPCNYDANITKKIA